MCQKALDLERSNGGEIAESKCRKDKDHDLWYGTGPPAELNSHALSVALEWAATASSSARQRTLITGVHGARELHAP